MTRRFYTYSRNLLNDGPHGGSSREWKLQRTKISNWFPAQKKGQFQQPLSKGSQFRVQERSEMQEPIEKTNECGVKTQAGDLRRSGEKRGKEGKSTPLRTFLGRLLQPNQAR